MGTDIHSLWVGLSASSGIVIILVQVLANAMNMLLTAQRSAGKQTELAAAATADMHCAEELAVVCWLPGV